jgi:hypothetical protein
MSLAAGLRSLMRPTWGKMLASLLLLETGVVLTVVATEVRMDNWDRGRMSYKLNPMTLWKDNPARPTVRPPVVAAAAARLQPQEYVIGVEIRGKARAYSVTAFDDPSGHLVNDLIDGVPVSVAYSNLSLSVRVYADPEGSRPLDAEVTGLLNGQMIIRLAGNVYFHDTGMPVEPAKNPPPIPYELLTPTVTTWKAWRDLHPESDIYVGGR